ncbi:MAG: DUF4394 domain-containing protein [Phycisphaerales bacterium]
MSTGDFPALSAATRLAALIPALVCLPANAETIYGITGAFAGLSLVKFESSSPNALTVVGPLVGVPLRHGVRGIDFRPSTGALYAVSNDDARAQLYRLDPGTAALTPVGPGFTFPDDPYARLSMDFNPVTDEIRLVTGSGYNVRIDPDTGAAAFDQPLAWAPGDTNSGSVPFAADVAHTNNAPGALSTTLYAYDFTLDIVAIQGGPGGSPPPETGVWNSVGSSGVVVIDAGVGFDISAESGAAYASYTRLGVEAFASVDLATGRFTEIGVFTGVQMLDIAVALPPPPACRADFDVDGAVATPDLTYFLSRFGSAPQPGTPQARADFDGDGQVDSHDLIFFLGRFGQLCP